MAQGWDKRAPLQGRFGGPARALAAAWALGSACLLLVACGGELQIGEAVDVGGSTLTAVPNALLADGSQPVTLQVVVRSRAGVALPGVRVTLAVDDARASLTQPAALSDATGTCMGTLTAAGPGTYTVTATAVLQGQQVRLGSPLALATVGAGPQEALPAGLLVEVDDPNVVAGAPLALLVTALDANGVFLTDYRGTLTVTSSDAAASLPAAAAFAGTGARAPLPSPAVLRTAGASTITVTDADHPALTATVDLQVGAAAVAGFSLRALSAGLQTGVGTDVALAAVDAFGNRVVDYVGEVVLASSDPIAQLAPPVTLAAADAGETVVPRAATFHSVGENTLSAADAGQPLLTGTSDPIRVTARGTQLVAVVSHASVVAGAQETLLVLALDLDGSLDVYYAGTVALSSSDGAAILPSTRTFGSGDHGVLELETVQLLTMGTQTLAVEEVGGSGVQAPPVSVQVVPAPPSQFLLALTPAAVAAGTAVDLRVTAADPFGNLATGYTGTVHLSSSDGQAGLPADLSFTGADAGVKQLPAAVTLYTSGLQTVTAHDTGPGGARGTSAPVAVSAGPATALSVSQIVDGPAGLARDVEVAGRDAYGNVAPTYVGSFALTSDDPLATFTGPFQIVAADAGAAHFAAAVVLRTAGTWTVTATDAGHGLSGSQSPVEVDPAPASGFTLSGLTANLVTGAASPLTLTAVDAFGNRATAYTGAVTLSSSDLAAELAAGVMLDAANQGQLVLAQGVTFNSVGTFSLTANGGAGLTGTLSPIPVHARSTSLQLDFDPNTLTAGGSGTLTVTAIDAGGSPDVFYTGTAVFSSDDPNATLPAPVTLSGGAASVQPGVVLTRAGTVTLSAQDGQMPPVTGTAQVTVLAGAAIALQLTGVPAPAVAGLPFDLTAAAVDAYGNPDPGYGAAVTFSIDDSNTTLPSPYTFASADGGLHTFPAGVTLRDRGSFTLTATDNRPGTPLTVSVPVVVQSAPPVRIVLTGLTGAPAGVSQTLTLTLYDTFNNVAADYSGDVEFSSTDPSATLPFPYTFSASDAGQAIFTDGVVLSTAGSQSVRADLVADPNVMGSQTGLVVTPGPASQFVLVGLGSSAYAGVAQLFTLEACDPYFNVDTAYTGTATFQSSDGAASLPAPITFAPADAGARTVADLLWRTPGPQSLSVADAATVPVSASLNLTISNAALTLARGANAMHTCALLGNEDLKCWGRNDSGQLGLGDSAARGPAPADMGAALPAVPLPARAVATATGDAHTCAILTDGSLRCFGANGSGQLGLGDSASRGAVPGEVAALPAINLGSGRTARAVVAGSNHTCALLDDSSVKCWGINSSGQLGLGDTAARGASAGDMAALPAVGLAPGHSVQRLTAGSNHTCALLDDGRVQCWGLNTSGQLGLGDTAARGVTQADMAALPAVDLGGQAALRLTAGQAFTCAQLADESLRCWGLNASGQLGLGDTRSRGGRPGDMGTALPAVSLGTGQTAVGLSAGRAHVCATLDTGDVKCWGANDSGGLGLGDLSSRGGGRYTMGDDLPTVALGSGRLATAVRAAAGFTCGLLDDHSVKCWGLNDVGELGLGDTSMRGDDPSTMGDSLPAASLF